MRLRSWRAATAGCVLLELERDGDGAGAAGSAAPGEAVAALALADDGCVRLRAAAGGALPPDPAPAVGRSAWRAAAAEPVATEGGLRLAHDGPRGAAEVEVRAEPFGVSVRDRGGARVAELSELELDAGGAARLSLHAPPSERFFGFGEQRGPLDKRGTRLRLRNRDPEASFRNPLYAGIPFFLGLSHGRDGGFARGVFLDAAAPSSFDVAARQRDRVRLETDAGGIDLLVIPGPRPRDVLARFTARVGRSPLPPLWALGHHQSRWSYASERQVRRVAAELRARRIPSDAIHLDIDYMDGYRVFIWHPRRFPDPKQLCSDLAGQGFRVVTIVDPGVKVDEDFPVFRDGCARDVFVRRDDGTPFTLSVWPGRSALPDFGRADVRAWWGEQHRPLLDAGVAGIWNDMNEPAGWARDVRLGRLIVPLGKQDLSRAVQADPADEKRRVPHEHVRNLYGYQECRATRDFLERASPERRPFVLTRSGHAGIQRHAAVWTGDVRSRWSHLAESLPMLANLSLSGVAFCGADIGGFFQSCTPELYARWIQIGALYPFARTHSMWAARRQEPWSFGPRVEAIAREALELRMRLLPYLYGLFREAEETGAPVWRPLFFEFPDDADAAAVQDQVMVGPSLLAAPILERGAREREVYLPPGPWYAWHDDARYVGPRRVRVAAPLEHIPLFARGGSVLPTRSATLHTGDAPREPCVLHAFPGADGAGELYEDDGESTAYQRGAEARTPLRLWSRGKRLRLELGRREGAHPIPPRPARAVVRACHRSFAVYIDGDAVPPGGERPGWTWSQGRLHVRFEDTGEGLSLEVEPAP